MSVLMNISAQTLLFDGDWHFHRGGAQGAERPEFDDSGWRNVDLPHDWSIEDMPGKQTPFDPDAINQVSGGFTVGGSGWYRKTFSLDAGEKNKKVIIQFDGVYMNAEFWLNGQSLGNHPYGYTSFWFDITDKVKFGGENVLAVLVQNEGRNSRWYTGSGIYRHVWLKIMNPVHTDLWGVYITTPAVTEENADVKIKTTVVNQGNDQANVKLITRIIDKNGVEKAEITSEQLLGDGRKHEFSQDLKVIDPELWSTDSPVLYLAVSEVYTGNELTDITETRFGIRSISFDTAYGFRLNGRTLKLKGGCVHHDNGPLGARTYDRAEERRVELLKASGFNAIRCSHNPPSPAFLDACDRLGMLVIDETFDMWRIANNPHDYHLYFDEWWQKDVESMVRRDRNHPSIIIWSIGNEIRNMEHPDVIAVGKKLGDYIRTMEPTRPIAAAVNNLHPQKDPFFAILDICGYNYAAGGDHLKKSIYADDHERVPERIMVGTESYALEAFGAWMPVNDYNYVIGDFVWTAFDYIGEASIGWRGYWQESSFYPWNLAYCGDIDICGWKRPQSYYRDALWKPNQVSVFVTPPEPSFPVNPEKQSWSKWEWHDVVPSWTWTGREGQSLEVTAYSSCEMAELTINGKSFGRKETNRSTEYMATWQIPYVPGELKVTGINGKKKIASAMLLTAGVSTNIRMTPDKNIIKADNQDLSYITIELTDEKGILNPNADDLIKFGIEGSGVIVGVGNANPLSIESYQLPQRKAWRGKCLVVVKSNGKPGEITLTVSAEGLPEAKMIIRAE
jgi:beta-galactosidase